MTTFSDASVATRTLTRSRRIPLTSTQAVRRRFVVPSLFILTGALWLVAELNALTTSVVGVLAAGVAVRIIGEMLFHSRAALLGMAQFLFAAPVLLVAAGQPVVSDRGLLEALVYYVPIQTVFVVVAVLAALRSVQCLLRVVPLVALATLPFLAGLPLLDALAVASVIAAPVAGWGMSRLWRMSLVSGWIAVLVFATFMWGGFRAHQTLVVGVSPAVTTIGEVST